MVNIDCFACGKTVKIPKFIDTNNYDGQLVCQECNSLLHVKLAKGKVQKYKIVENKHGVKTWADVLEMAKEAEKRQEKEERPGGTSGG